MNRLRDATSESNDSMLPNALPVVASGLGRRSVSGGGMRSGGVMVGGATGVSVSVPVVEVVQLLRSGMRGRVALVNRALCFGGEVRNG